MTKGTTSKALGLYKNLCQSLHKKLLRGIRRLEVRDTALPLIRKGQRVGRNSRVATGARERRHGAPPPRCLPEYNTREAKTTGDTELLRDQKRPKNFRGTRSRSAGHIGW